MAKKDSTQNKSHTEKKGDKGSKKKNTSLRLEGKMLKALKILAIQEDSSVQQIIEKLVSDYLTARGIQFPIDDSEKDDAGRKGTD